MKRIRTGSVAKRIAAFALTGMLLVYPIALPVPAMAESSLQAELQAAIADLSELSEQLAQSEAELGKTNYLLETTKSRIKEVQKQIDQNEKDLDVARDRLAEVIEESYKQGGEIGLLDIVLSSDSFDTLLSRMYYANRVAQKKQAAINNINDVITELDANKSDLEEQQSTQEALLATQKEQHAAMEQAAMRQTDYVNSLSNELRASMEAERAQHASQSVQTAQQVLGSNYVAPNAQQQASAPAASNDGGASYQATTTSYDDGGSADAGQASGGVTAASSDYVPEVAPTPAAETPSAPAESYDSYDSYDSSADYSYEAPAATDSYSSGYSSESYSSGSSSGYSSDAAMVAVNAALAQVGKSYSHDNDGNSWDCNGLTNYAWSSAGVDIPYASGTYAYGQFQYMQESGNYTTSADNLNAGDLVFYSQDGGDTCYHVAMYIGDGQIVHAVDYSSGVQVTDLDYVSGFCGGGSPY